MSTSGSLMVLLGLLPSIVIGPRIRGRGCILLFFVVQYSAGLFLRLDFEKSEFEVYLVRLRARFEHIDSVIGSRSVDCVTPKLFDRIFDWVCAYLGIHKYYLTRIIGLI